MLLHTKLLHLENMFFSSYLALESYISCILASGSLRGHSDEEKIFMRICNFKGRYSFNVDIFFHLGRFSKFCLAYHNKPTSLYPIKELFYISRTLTDQVYMYVYASITPSSSHRTSVNMGNKLCKIS